MLNEAAGLHGFAYVGASTDGAVRGSQRILLALTDRTQWHRAQDDVFADRKLVWKLARHYFLLEVLPNQTWRFLPHSEARLGRSRVSSG